MKEVVFGKLTIQNFLSIGNDPVIVDFVKGINFITGFNKDQNSRNGVGKTSIVAAIFFALYGEIDRKMTKSSIANNLNADSCIVELTFKIHDDEYRIVRMLRPSKLFLYVNGIDKSKTMPETDQDILKILGNTTKEVFEQTVVMSSNNALPFLAQKNTDKVEFIEGILSLGFFGDMLDIARKKYNKTDKELSASESKYKTLTTQLESQKDSYRSVEKSKLDDIAILNQEKEKLSADISRLEKEISINSDELLKQKEELKKSITDVETKYNKDSDNLRVTISEQTKKLEDLEKNNINSFDEQQKQKDELYAKIKTIEQKEENANKIRDSITSELAEIRAELSQKDKEIVKLEETKTHCPTCSQPLKDLDPSHIENAKKTAQDEKNIILEREKASKEKMADFLVKFEKLKTVKGNTNDKIQEIDRYINKVKQEEQQQKNVILEEIKKIERKIADNVTLEREDKRKINLNIDAIDNKINSVKIKENDIKNIGNSLKLKDEEIVKIKEKENPFKKIIIESRENIKVSEKEVSDLKHKRTVLDNVKFVVSPEGLKSYIIKKIIKLFNQRLDFYLKRLNAPCTCIFNEFFEEKILNTVGQEITYANLSGGEKKRLDVAMLFTFRDIRKHQTGITFNISVFDEIFDSAIDSNGMDKIMGILSDAVQNNDESFYIVTHRKENVDYDNIKVIELVKEKGFTKRIS